VRPSFPSEARAGAAAAMRASLPLALLVALPPACSPSQVDCGGHHAPTCADCPQGHGEGWCNGECRWRRGRCVGVEDSGSAQSEDVDSSGPAFAVPPDTRPRGCPAGYDPAVGDMRVSIIIPWLKEKWTHMKGTMEALLQYTPEALVEEVIFVSDGNPDAREKALKAMSPKVKVIELPERQGLIRAKMRGVAAASAPILVFMEAHCIVNRMWLEPLLDRIREEPKALVMPALDIIPQEDWGRYFKTPPILWRYEWNMNLITSNPGTIRDGPDVYTSPGTSGGIFAMKKDWFEQLELFDTGMSEWGGDHFELTMKVWRCGGRIEIAPCSRIGHLFRDPEHRPYDVEVNTVVANYKLLANVWLKDHLDYFYRMKPESVSMPLPDMEERLRKHDSLNCKNMSWYLSNVDPEMLYEMDKLCHPYIRGPDQCHGKLAPGRFTITDASLMPRDEYVRQRRAADARLQAERQAERQARGRADEL